SRKRSRRGARVLWLAALAAILLVGFVGMVLVRQSHRVAVRTEIGYIDDVSTLENEFVKYMGQPLKDANIREQFSNAASLVSQRDYSGAIALLEGILPQAAVPVLYNNLGVLYEQTNDRDRSINAFREALSRDAGYQPVRMALQQMKNLTPGA